MIENIRTHPYTRAVCRETARLFERRAAKDLVEAQRWTDEGVSDRAREFQAKARVAQERAKAWHLRARNASPDRPNS
jgi:aromatic ring hydroxylase